MTKIRAFIRGKIKYVARNKNGKNYLGFRIPKIWQILKCFIRSFYRAWDIIYMIATCNFKCVAILTENRIFRLNSTYATTILLHTIVIFGGAVILKGAIVILWNKIRTWHQVNDYYLLAPVIILLLLSSWLAFSSPLFWQLDVQLKICPHKIALVSSDFVR